jgi:poly-gamma-glutamate capsule biosynthesis protein CapA/YwtB (metallophosphatase superfamily)
MDERKYYCAPIKLYNSRFFEVLKKIGILFILVSIVLGCSLRTENYVPKGAQKTVDEFRPADRVTLSAIGDIMVHGAQLKSAWDDANYCYNFEPVFSQVKEFLSAADITIGNLETTLPGREKLYSGYPQFGAPDALVPALQGAGVDILTTANNHTCDKGERGLIRTIKVLDAYGLLHVGTYRDKDEYETKRILIVERNHIRLALLGYTYGVNDMPIPAGTYVNLIDQQQITDDIKLARSHNPDFIIVLIHWGTEYERYPNEFQTKTVAFLFSEGVDIVLGSHPHVLQPFELQSVTDKYGVTKPRLVIYSLGNFVSNQRDRYRDGGIIFNFTLEKHHSTDKGTTLHITDVHYIPTWVYVHRTPDKNQFYILPVLKYLKNDQPLQLPEDAYQKMLTFYQDAQVHLASNQTQKKARMNSQPHELRALSHGR